jgi:hypothetical protein
MVLPGFHQTLFTILAADLEYEKPSVVYGGNILKIPFELAESPSEDYAKLKNTLFSPCGVIFLSPWPKR